MAMTTTMLIMTMGILTRVFIKAKVLFVRITPFTRLFRLFPTNCCVGVPSFTLDWDSKMDRASNSLHMLNHAARNSGFDSGEPIKDKDKLKAQERAETIIRRGSAAVTMDLDDK